MPSQIRNSDVTEMCIRVMKVLHLQKTKKYESANKESVWKEACELGSPVSEYISGNFTLKNLVFKELYHRLDIQRGATDEEICITSREASRVATVLV